jgi:hypothetical protein
MQKLYLLKLFHEWGEEGIKKSGRGVNSSMIYLIDCKNFCKCHNVPPPSTIKIILKVRNELINIPNVMFQSIKYKRIVYV